MPAWSGCSPSGCQLEDFQSDMKDPGCVDRSLDVVTARRPRAGAERGRAASPRPHSAEASRQTSTGNLGAGVVYSQCLTQVQVPNR